VPITQLYVSNNKKNRVEFCKIDPCSSQDLNGGVLGVVDDDVAARVEGLHLAVGVLLGPIL
jgi:hypothetical protein